MTDLPLPPAPRWREADRLAALDRYQIMDTPAEPEFDDLVRIAAQICGVPMALISLVDEGRQWFKAALGVDAPETPRDIAFCAHAIQQRDLFLVPDATQDGRFAANPLVTGDMSLKFYAGAPLETPDGLPLGTLCVLDRRPRELTEEQRYSLQALARQVVAQLELRRALARLSSSEERHRRILESAIDYGIISMDLNGVVTSWNEGARRIFGWTEAEMCGQPCDLFFTPEDRARDVPLIEFGAALTKGHGSDERWHIRKDGARFWASGEMMPLTNEADEPVGFLKILRDRTEFRRAEDALRASERAAEEHRLLLLNELEHRVKNTLALVQAVVSQSLRNTTSPQEALTNIEERLVALGRAHDILTSTSWSAAPISSIIAAATQVHGSGLDRIRASGPDFNLMARPALSLTMALHELCTNAAKYGALSNDAGHVDIRWSIMGEGDAARFEFVWREVGGPPVLTPTRKGFGSRLVATSLSAEVDGKSRVDFAPDGVVWTASAKLKSIQED
jgi:PAS domain S-box-containing protein